MRGCHRQGLREIDGSARGWTERLNRLWIGIMDLAGVWWLIRRKRTTPVAIEFK